MRNEFIQRYLNKHPSELTWDDLSKFIFESIEENLTLEYKPRGMLVDKSGSPIKSKNRYDVCGFSQLAKLVSGFANSAGGLLVLGVKEKSEKHKGQIIKVRPGAFSEIPPTITREMIEHNLEAKIQIPIDSVSIIPLRKTPRSKNCVYLIDVPPSDRGPHRVNEVIYYQRHNFSTVEMQHYQIADMFGRRLRPNLDISIENIDLQINARKSRTVNIGFKITNSGRAVAKYVTCLCSAIEGGDSIMGRGWKIHDGGKTVQYETKLDRVIYPDIPLGVGKVIIHKTLNGDETGKEPIELSFQLYAEGMPGQWVCITIDPSKKLVSNIRKGGK